VLEFLYERGEDIYLYSNRIIKDCDLMAFFRTLIHYSKMEKQRKNTIERWKDEYRESAIMVDLLSETRLTFQDEG
jgi:hypothetical protein